MDRSGVYNFLCLLGSSKCGLFRGLHQRREQFPQYHDRLYEVEVREDHSLFVPAAQRANGRAHRVYYMSLQSFGFQGRRNFISWSILEDVSSGHDPSC